MTESHKNKLLSISVNDKKIKIYIDKSLGKLDEEDIKKKCEDILKNEKNIIRDLEKKYSKYDKSKKSINDDPEYIKNGKNSWIDSFEIIESIDGNTTYDIGIFEYPRQIYGVVRNNKIIDNNDHLFIY